MVLLNKTIECRKQYMGYINAKQAWGNGKIKMQINNKQQDTSVGIGYV